MRKNAARWRFWLAIFGGWTLFSLIFICQGVIYNAYFGKSAALGQVLVSWLSCAFIWALLTPSVVNLARRFPVEKGIVWRNLAIHFVAGLLLSLFQLAIYVAVRRWLPFGFPESQTAWQSFQIMLIATSHENLLLYWSVVGLTHVAEYYRRFRERERRAAQLELEAAQLETQLARAQLDALKMQLHPHFLFNTLNSISVLMREDVQAANRMLVRLSELLRVALKNNSANEITLGQELEFLRSYLEIEQVRFQDRLKIKIEAAPEILEARVPNLILQPLVENAIRHAVAPRAAETSIEVRAERSNGHLRLIVRDDGDGIAESKIGTGGIGLANTGARLEKLYGARQKLELSNRAGVGLEVSVTIPFHTTDDDSE